MPGQRVALNLSGVTKQDIERGDVVCDGTLSAATDRIDTLLRIADTCDRIFENWIRVRFYLGTSEVFGRAILLSAEEGLDATLKKYNLDAIVAPTVGPMWQIDLIDGDHIIPPWATKHWAPSVAAVSGYPHVSVPGGYIHGIPIGISFLGAAYSEPTLIKIAYAYEKATEFRLPPEFLPGDPFMD